MSNKKHDWEPAGIYENKFVEAKCNICGRRECAAADFCDTDKIIKFWERIGKLRDCPVKRRKK